MTMPMRIPRAASPAWTAFRRGFVAALPFIVSNGLAGVVMGVAYRGVGLDALGALAFSVVVYSATAQAVTLGLWGAPPPRAPPPARPGGHPRPRGRPAAPRRDGAGLRRDQCPLPRHGRASPPALRGGGAAGDAADPAPPRGRLVADDGGGGGARAASRGVSS